MKSKQFVTLSLQTLTGIWIITLLAISCESPPVNFTRADRRLIDSMFQMQKPAIDKEVDSLCKIWAEKNLDRFKDSLMTKRWSEIEQILQSEN